MTNMRGGSTSTKRLCALLLTLLCVAVRFQGIVCPPGGRGGGGVGAGEGEGAGAGAGEGGEAAGASGSRSVDGGGSTYTYGWPSSIITTDSVVGPSVEPSTAAESPGRGVWIVSVAAAAALACTALAWW